MPPSAEIPHPSLLPPEPNTTDRLDSSANTLIPVLDETGTPKRKGLACPSGMSAADSRTYGPEPRPPDWKQQGTKAGKTSDLERGRGGAAGFWWGVTVEAPKSSASAPTHGQQQTAEASRAPAAAVGRNFGGAGPAVPVPVDDAVVVKSLTSQVRGAASHTTVLVPGVFDDVSYDVRVSATSFRRDGGRLCA